MSSSFGVDFQGMSELVAALRNSAGIARPLTQAFYKIGLDQKSASRKAAPVDVGKLRNSITYEVDTSPIPTFVRIGTIGGDRPEYAAYMEYGTGRVHDHPNWPHKRHVVPPEALVEWVIRKGRVRNESKKRRERRIDQAMDTAERISEKIFKRGGLLPRRYLRGPFEENEQKYKAIIEDAIGKLSLG